MYTHRVFIECLYRVQRAREFGQSGGSKAGVNQTALLAASTRHLRTCMRVCMGMCVYLCLCLRLCMSMCIVSVYVSVSVYAYAYEYEYLCASVCIHVRMNVCMYDDRNTCTI